VLETAPVEAFRSGATPEGVLQLAGNVWEWVFDAYAPNGGDAHAIRGGGYLNEPDMLRGATRMSIGQRSRHIDLGFRCARSK
jgi:iron(II)-dependent oxidoreductase